MLGWNVINLKNKKNIGIALLVFGFLVVYFFTPLKTLLSQENIENIKFWIQQKGPLAPLFFIILYGGATVLLVPGSILTILGGLIFGATLGTLFVLIGANLGALAAFLISRYVGRDTIRAFLYNSAEKLEQKIKLHGFYVVFWLRFIPIFPFSILNYALGLTSVTLKDYLWASFLGIIPGTFVYASLGNAASKISLTDPKVWTRLDVWGPFALVILLSFLPRIFKRKQKELEKLTDKKQTQHGNRGEISG